MFTFTFNTKRLHVVNRKSKCKKEQTVCGRGIWKMDIISWQVKNPLKRELAVVERTHTPHTAYLTFRWNALGQSWNARGISGISKFSWGSWPGARRFKRLIKIYILFYANEKNSIKLLKFSFQSLNFLGICLCMGFWQKVVRNWNSNGNHQELFWPCFILRWEVLKLERCFIVPSPASSIFSLSVRALKLLSFEHWK